MRRELESEIYTQEDYQKILSNLNRLMKKYPNPRSRRPSGFQQQRFDDDLETFRKICDSEVWKTLVTRNDIALSNILIYYLWLERIEKEDSYYL